MPGWRALAPKAKRLVAHAPTRLPKRRSAKPWRRATPACRRLQRGSVSGLARYSGSRPNSRALRNRGVSEQAYVVAPAALARSWWPLLMAHRVPSIVSELGADTDPFVLHL